MMLLRSTSISIRPAGRVSRVLAAVAVALAVCCTGVGLAVAQDDLPDSLTDQSTHVQGDQLTFCLDPGAPGAPFDRSVGQAIADALFVKAKFIDSPSGFPIDAGGYLAELRIVMANSCDVLLGISLQPNFPYPDWATPTHAYAAIPFVLAVTDPGYKSLADIPRDKPLGTAMGSVGEANFITYSLQQPEAQRWKRWPYVDPNLMVKRLKEGTLAGIVLWQPALNAAAGGNPTTAGLRVIPLDPVPAASVQVAALVSSRDSYLRSQLDEAIKSLIEDGTVKTLLSDAKFAGTPAAQ